MTHEHNNIGGVMDEAQAKTKSSTTQKAEFTNRDLANMIGTTRETVSRTLTKLKKEQHIETDLENDIIFDPSILEEELFS